MPKINSAQILQQVVDKNASDLHMVVGSEPMIRVSTVLQVLPGYQPFTEDDILYFISQLFDAQQKQLFEVNKELDFSISLGNKSRFRVNTFYQKGYPSVALRRISMDIPSFKDLGLPEVLGNICTLKQGLVLIVGPTGQGKSTTIAAMIDRINETRAEHIITIEDPIEYVFPNKKSLIEQREMYLDSHSWEAALKSIFRQDPNVVLIGELRDSDTMSTALQIAETGHVVFATLHTSSAAQTVERIISSFSMDKQAEIRTQLSQVLEVVISQRLLPTVKGGVTPAIEILLGTDSIRAMIRENKTHMIDNIISTSSNVGMVSLEHSLANLVASGLVGYDEALRSSLKPEELKRIMGQRRV